MARVTIEDCLTNMDSRFTLVHLAVRRVLQLRHGAPPTLENAKGNKEIVLALREIAAETITVDNIRQIEEARQISEPAAAPAPVEAAAIDIKEILDEATSFAANVEFEGSSDVFEEDQGADRDASEEE